MIQIPHRCEYYKKNENMNLTCTFKGIEKMCRIYYGEQCKEYNDEKFNFDSDFIALLIGLNQINQTNKKLNRLIELNTPEAINVLPDLYML